MSHLISEPSILSWSTGEINAQERLSYWVEAICEAFLEMKATSEQMRQFDGHIETIAHSRMNINKVQASAHDVFRTTREISAGMSSPFYLICDAKQAWQIKQGRQVVDLRPGDAVLLDSSRPFEFHYPGGASLLSLQIPRSNISQWVAQPETNELRVTRHDQNWGAAIAAVSQLLTQNMSNAFMWNQDLLVDHLGSLIGAAINPQQEPPTRIDKDIPQLAINAMQNRLSQPGLTAAHIAQELGISIRTLHRAFAANQESFLNTLQKLRLDLAQRMLIQPSFKYVSTAEIGRRCGFPEASHFAKIYARRFAISPSHWRQLHKLG